MTSFLSVPYLCTLFVGPISVASTLNYFIVSILGRSLLWKCTVSDIGKVISIIEIRCYFNFISPITMGFSQLLLKILERANKLFYFTQSLEISIYINK